MSSALVRGRTLNPRAVMLAARQRASRLKYLNDIIKAHLILGLTRREAHEWRHLTGLMHP